MRYAKPTVVDLAHGAAGGQETPDSCYSGTDADGSGFGTCQAGTAGGALYNQCTTGPNPGAGDTPICVSGPAPGTSFPFCQTGGDGGDYGDTCTNGPSPA